MAKKNGDISSITYEENEGEEKSINKSLASAGSAIITLSEFNTPSVRYTLPELFSSRKRNERLKKLDERANEILNNKVELFLKLKKSGIDEATFEKHLNNDLNRILKKQYGTRFFILTILFTLISYVVVILNSTCNWQIPEFAITALIIEIPIQFVGILAIVAKNLFPESNNID
mgnify:CR=1 FL=1